jgi:hypothetical protein
MFKGLITYKFDDKDKIKMKEEHKTPDPTPSKFSSFTSSFSCMKGKVTDSYRARDSDLSFLSSDNEESIAQIITKFKSKHKALSKERKLQE